MKVHIFFSILVSANAKGIVLPQYNFSLHLLMLQTVNLLSYMYRHDYQTSLFSLLGDAGVDVCCAVLNSNHFNCSGTSCRMVFLAPLINHILAALCFIVPSTIPTRVIHI
jgi:hypothetical protein